jgi:hypothetical protein
MIREMLVVCQHYAPTGTEQEAFAAMTRRMQDVGMTEKYIINALAGALQDGLQHGNWPTK